MKGTSEDRKKAKDIAAIQGQIFNLKFVIELSGSCEIYKGFGHAINILQIVNFIPHIKYDEFISTAVDGLRQMADTALWTPKTAPVIKLPTLPIASGLSCTKISRKYLKNLHTEA